MTGTTARALPGLGALAGDYDGFLVDVWGVLHNGVAPFPGVIDALRRLRDAGKKVVLLSNVARRAPSLVEDLAVMGIAGDLYHAAMTSGEAAHAALRDRADPWHARLGRRCLYLGPERRGRVIDGLDLERVETAEAADFVIVARIQRAGEALDSHDPMLRAAAARGLPMLCANPDLEAVIGADRVVCPGAVARRYEEMGGSVFYHGKPHRPVYDRAIRLLEGIGRARVAGVGDALRTDVAGAADAGLASILVATGIHAEAIGPWPFDSVRLAALFAREGRAPDVVIPGFRWD